MQYPLAHDENGSPIEIPATAAGWLVRRHSGGRGRPGAVYDHDGRPLVLPLESTAADLRAGGCRPAMYRLDAVDSNRKVLGVAAYTEVRRDEDAPERESSGAAGSSIGDAAVAALARAVEAMQRVQAEREKAQAERERAQAEMLSRLIERLAPPPPPPVPRNMPDVLREFTDVQKLVRKLAPEESDGGDEASSIDAGSLIQQAIGLATMFLEQRFGVPAGAGVNASKAEEATESEVADEPEDGGDEADELDDLDTQVDAVLARLSPAEARQVAQLSKLMPKSTLDAAMRQLATMSTDEAVAKLRQMLKKPAAKVKTAEVPVSTSETKQRDASKGAA